jgi:hypothetical protein
MKHAKHYTPTEIKELKQIINTTNKFSTDRTEKLRTFADTSKRSYAGVLFKVSTLSKRTRNSKYQGKVKDLEDNISVNKRTISIKIKSFKIDNGNLIITY